MASQVTITKSESHCPFITLAIDFLSLKKAAMNSVHRIERSSKDTSGQSALLPAPEVRGGSW
jgi:hypothetical protein